MTHFQKQLSRKRAEQWQSSASHVGPTDKLSSAKLQCAACAILSDDLMWVAGVCKCPEKHAKMTLQCKDTSTTPSSAAFLALMPDQRDCKNCCEAFGLEIQSTLYLATEAKELREKISYCDKQMERPTISLRAVESKALMQTIRMLFLLKQSLQKKMFYIRDWLMLLKIQSRCQQDTSRP